MSSAPTGPRGADDEEARLLGAARNGDREALDALMRRHRTRVVRYAVRLCISPEDAEDAAQETLVSLARYVSAFRAAAALSTWLFTVVRRHCTRLARRSLRRALHLDAAPDVPDDRPTAEDAFVDEQLRVRLAALIAEMPADAREVLVRRDVLGQPAAEVAAALGLSLPAVKSRLHRARADIRARLLGEIEGSRTAPDALGLTRS